MDKEIKEISNIISDNVKFCKWCADAAGRYDDAAEAIYEAGYRNVKSYQEKIAELKKEIVEMIVWLLLEYRSSRSKLNANGLSTLTHLREKWNIEKADKLFAAFCKEEENGQRN